MPYIVRNQIKYATGSGSGGGNTNSVDLTMAEYEALEAQGKVSEDTTYYITDASVEGMFSSGIVKLTQAEYDALPESKYSDGVLYAITDGENSGSVGKPVELTREQYEALGDSVLNDNILYAITDGDGLSAKNLAFDDNVTQFGVNNVQDAIVEQNKKINDYYKLSVTTPSNDTITKVADYPNGYTYDNTFVESAYVVYDGQKRFINESGAGVCLVLKTDAIYLYASGTAYRGKQYCAILKKY